MGRLPPRLLPAGARVVTAVRRLFLEKLAAAHDDGSLLFFGEHVRLVGHHEFAAYPAPLRKTEWVV